MLYPISTEILRDKLLSRTIWWIIGAETKIPEKRAFPVDKLTPDQIGFLKIGGEFVYRRQGG